MRSRIAQLSILALVLLVLAIALTGCTVSDASGRFDRIGFAGIFEPGVTIILDTKTDQVWVIGAGALADGAIASALRRPSRMTSVLSGGNAEANANSDASADSDASGGGGHDLPPGHRQHHGGGE